MRLRRISGPARAAGLRRLIAVIAAGVALQTLAVTPLVAAGLVDPLLHFRQIRTGHFVIYFHQGEEQVARRLAAIVEDVRLKVATSLALPTPRLTHVILADQSELANGWATPLPRNTVFLNAAAPSGADFIGRTDDWLRLVFTHEYTHIVHLDRSGAWAWLVRGVLGRNAVAFPNLWLPQWQVEGLATWEESGLTGGGRRSAGDFRAIEDVAAQARRPITLDRASGGLVGWPDGHAAYAAGLGFHEYLVARFGQQSLGRLARSTSRRLPFFGTRAYYRVFGESLGSLWRDYERQLPMRSTAATQTEVHRLTRTGHVVVGPRFVPRLCESCPAEIVFSARTPEEFPSLRVVDVNGGADRRLARRYLGSTVGLSGPFVLFDQQELRRNVAVYSDLHLLDRRSGQVRALTHEARLQDPDLAADGESIVAVRERGGRRDLVVTRLEREAMRVEAADPGSESTVLASSPDTQFSAPRWSPDGARVAVARRRLGALPDVVILDARTGSVLQTIADAGARIVTPAWRPDGGAIVAAADFDERGFDLYEFALATTSVARRLTRTRGALWPDVSSDSTTLVFAGYTAEGYDLFSARYQVLDDEPPRSLRPVSVDAPPHIEAPALPARDYAPWGTIAPTSWTPLLVADADQTRLGAAVAGSDLLGRHAYGVTATWLVEGPDLARPIAQSSPDWAAVYAYNRWRPSLFVSGSSDTLFRTVRDGAAAHEIPVAVAQREAQAGLFVPVVHLHRSSQALLALVRTDATYRLPGQDRRITLVSSRLAIAHDTTHRYGYSISREGGINVGATIELARRALGADADATTATADLRAYGPGLGRQHVIAVRAAAGVSRGADLARQVFTIGAVRASPSVIAFSSDAIGLVRGAAAASGRRMIVGNAEYRFPIARIERGRGTWPLLLRTAHAALFADAAQVVDSELSGAVWARALGGELSVDAVAGYSLPFSATAGVAWAGHRPGPAGLSAYMRLGRAF
ncbi:MAG TPA: hypothetical protein VM032_18445 [Vicinamibacterales bacterium]|nr:hypothetical protein [Vicinamibacterales bacterium]